MNKINSIYNFDYFISNYKDRECNNDFLNKIEKIIVIKKIFLKRWVNLMRTPAISEHASREHILIVK